MFQPQYKRDDGEWTNWGPAYTQEAAAKTVIPVLRRIVREAKSVASFISYRIVESPDTLLVQLKTRLFPRKVNRIKVDDLYERGRVVGIEARTLPEGLKVLHSVPSGYYCLRETT